MEKLLFLIVLFSVFVAQGQDIRSSTVTAGSTYGSVLKLAKDEIPLAVYMDSVNTITSVSFYVLLGDSSGTDSSDYMPLTLVGDTTVYSAPLTRLKYMPLNSSLFYSLFPNPSYAPAYRGAVYIRPKLAAAQSLNKVIKIRVGIDASPTSNDISISTSSSSSITNFSHPPTHFLVTTGTDTCGGSIATSWIDTLTSVSDYYQTWSIMPLNDTAQVSVVSGLFTTAQILLPYQVFTITVDPLLNPKFYVRRYGTDGTVTYQIYGGGY
jgi:hypothetical protein